MLSRRFLSFSVVFPELDSTDDGTDPEPGRELIVFNLGGKFVDEATVFSPFKLHESTET